MKCRRSETGPISNEYTNLIQRKASQASDYFWPFLIGWAQVGDWLTLAWGGVLCLQPAPKIGPAYFILGIKPRVAFNYNNILQTTVEGKHFETVIFFKIVFYLGRVHHFHYKRMRSIELKECRQIDINQPCFINCLTIGYLEKALLQGMFCMPCNLTIFQLYVYFMYE